MSVSRLNELKEISPTYSREKQNIEKPDSASIEEFNCIERQVTEISQFLGDFENLIHQIQELHVKMIQTIIIKDKKAIKEQYSVKMLTIKKLITQIQKLLESFNKEFEKRSKTNQKDNLQSKGVQQVFPLSSTMRMMQSHHFVLCNQFQKLLHQYFDIQELHKEHQNSKIRKEISILNPNLTPEQIEEMALNSKGQELTMYKKTLQGSQIGTLNSYHDEAVELRKDVYQIEESLKDLQELFVSFGQIMMDQQPLLDDIEENLTNADRDIRQGTEYLKSAPGKSITNPFLK